MPEEAVRGVDNVKYLVIDRDQLGGPPGSPPADGGDDDAPLVYCSDDFLGVELSKKLGDDWICLHPGATRFHWTGKVWRPDHKKRVVEVARRVCRRIARTLTAEKTAGLKRTITSKERVAAAVSFACSDERHARVYEEFDADLWALNTPAGIVDLRTGQMQAHDRAAMMTKMTAVAPEGECRLYHEFETEITSGDPEYRDFLRSFGGYCLTGSCEEEIFVFLYGKHGNTGKTTWQSVLRYILGDYAVVAPINVFIVTGGERHPTELADLRGARAVIVGETGKDDVFDEAKLKKLTGRDQIRARHMREDFFEFEATHKLIFAGNHLPKLRSGDHAMRRRTRICPFDNPHKKVDRRHGAALKAEGGGILKLLIEAAVRWQGASSLGEPKIVREATDRYFENANPLRQWLRERCELRGNYRERSTLLHADFTKWAKDFGHKEPAQRVFTADLDGIEGISHKHYRDGAYFEGVRLSGSRGALGGLEQRPKEWGATPANVPDWPSDPVPDPADDWPR